MVKLIDNAINVIMMVGAPTVGKSTWIKNNPFASKMVVASTDDIMEEIASEHGLNYSEAFKDNIKLAETLFRDLIKQTIADRSDLVIDRTNMSEKSRNRIFNLIESANVTKAKIHYHFVVFEIPSKEKFIEANDFRSAHLGKHIPLNVFDSMVKTFQMPTVAFDRTIYLVKGM